MFNLDGERRHLAVRERVGRGELAGPTIYTAGPFADGSSVRSPADAQRFVRGQKQAGYDFVKLHGDLDRESFEALARAGRDEGIPIVGHAPRELP
ncbi:MAG: amidohydrolase, partial [Gemmatimonadetes bacterium]|nr:amidohydrolase [Gemmatimonadota bacterium]NIV62787.1 amidohydrolase [Gemmatimonadota bacterium]NIW63817.1 amidohydrolase [Gemmatimonadota bacterium]